MENRKMKRLNLGTLEEVFHPFNADVLCTVVGGGNGTENSPYTWAEVDDLIDTGMWYGGYVNNNGSPYYLGGSTGATIYGNSGGSGGGWLTHPFVSIIGSAIGSAIHSILGIAFSAAEIFDSVRSYNNGEINSAMLGNKTFWVGAGLVAGGPFGALMSGFCSYIYGAAIEFTAEQISQFNTWADQYFSNPNNWMQP